MARRVARLAGLALLCATPLRAQSPALPIFDTHIHYSAPDWTEYPPDRILGILQQAGIKRALVSSTPDDGTLTLYQKDPKRVVPQPLDPPAAAARMTFKLPARSYTVAEIAV